MIITEISIPEGYLGLGGSKLSRLGRVVVLAGPNGSGKSRILRAVENFTADLLTQAALDEAQYDLSNLRNNIVDFERRLEMLSNAGEGEALKSAISKNYQRMEDVSAKIEASKRVVIDQKRREAKPKVVRYGVRNISLRSAEQMKRAEIRSAPERIEHSFGVDTIHEDALPAITQLAEAAAFARGMIKPNATSQGHIARYDKLNSSLQLLLGSPLGWSEDTNEPTIFGRSLNSAGLSDGQKILLAIATSLALQNGTSDELILLLDEPEIHLHPKALIEMLERIDHACPNAQIWIATHSIHVLAHYGEKNIYSVLNGVAAYSGSGWGSVLDSLLGGEDGIELMRSFLSVPFKVATNTFIAECILPPEVVWTPVGDPQTSQISEQLNRISASGRKLRVLDYGCGEARLLDELIARGIDWCRSALDYFCFDLEGVPDVVKRRCIEKLDAIYPGEGLRRYVPGEIGLRQRMDRGSVDIAILCNVLHEVSPRDWKGLMGPGGVLDNVLKSDAIVLLIEDHELPTGEQAHQFNFLVMDVAELKKFFGERPESRVIDTIVHPKYPDRLKLHVVPRYLLKQVNDGTRIAALEELVATASSQARKYSQGVGARAGRKFAFWAMQHLNASMALSDFRR